MKAERVRVATEPAYEVHVGAGALEGAGEWVRRHERRALLVDARVEALHGARLAAFEIESSLALAPGEERKSMRELEGVLDFLAEARLDRGSLLVTFGGGVVSDLGGLAASLFKRGIDVLHLPTTLLAQVDASVGGKTAINLKAGKNLAGSFHQPVAVFCDTLTLATLDERELASGLGEVLKTAWIGGESALARLEALAPSLLRKDPEALAAVVRDCVATKARVVAEDPLERGPRRVLNLGHTFAHAIEGAAGFGAIPHGVAVAVGIGLAFELAARLKLLEDPACVERQRRLSAALKLPTRLAELERASGRALASTALLGALDQDKKGRVGLPEFVLPRRAGEFALGQRAPRELLAELLASR